MQACIVRCDEFNFTYEPKPFAQTVCTLIHYRRIFICEHRITNDQIIMLCAHIIGNRYVDDMFTVQLFELGFETIALVIRYCIKPSITLFLRTEINHIADTANSTVSNMCFTHVPRYRADLQFHLYSVEPRIIELVIILVCIDIRYLGEIAVCFKEIEIRHD